MAAEEESESERLFLADEAIDSQREQLRELQTVMEAARATLEQGERALRDEREQVNGAERELREAEFAQRECRNKLQELAGNRVLAQQQLERARRRTGALRGKRRGHAGRGSGAQVAGSAGSSRRSRTCAGECPRRPGERGERSARSRRTALKVEQSLDPLRDRIGELKLKEQAAALNFEQFASQLAEANADEQSLQGELAGARRAVCRMRLPRCSARSTRSVRSTWRPSTNSKRRVNARAISIASRKT
jgi:chromosome segregation protein